MKAFVKVTAKHLHLPQTLKALDYAWEAHDGQYRKRSVIPYIHHPLNMACHALAMNIADDDIIASCLLHDVVEDCGKSVEELPGNDRIKTIVRLLTHPSSTDENRDDIMRPYYQAIAEDPGAALVKCLDRCNNLTTMSWGLRRERIVRMIRETETYYPELWNTLKRTPEYNNAAWLLRYQTESMLDIYKRLL